MSSRRPLSGTGRLGDPVRGVAAGTSAAPALGAAALPMPMHMPLPMPLGEAGLPAWVPDDLPFGDLVEALEGVFPGQKGWALTQALKASGYVRDTAAFDAAYEGGQAQIDPYLQQLDVAQLADDALTAPAQRAVQDYGPAVAGGAAAGILGTLIISALLR